MSADHYEVGWKNPDGTDRRKCPAHNFWIRKNRATGVKACELCLREAEQRRKEYEKLGGSNKPPVKVGKL